MLFRSRGAYNSCGGTRTTDTSSAWYSSSKAAIKKPPSCGNLAGAIDKSFHSSPQDELAVASKFCRLCFVPQSRDCWSACSPRRVAFWGAAPLVEKRCEDASHSQSTSRTQAGRQCEMPWTHSGLSMLQRNPRLDFWLRLSRPVESTIKSS